MRSKTLCALAVTAGTLTAVPAASAAAPPANDAFETPAVLGNASVTGTLDEATRQAGEPEHGWRSVWYVHRPSKTGRIAVRLSPEYGWGAVTVYTGPSITALQRVGRALELGYGARVAFDAVAGQEYRIVVASRCDGCSSSPFDLRVGPAPLPANDDFSAARTIRIPGEYKGNTADATAELGEAERHRHSVWYRIKPRRTGDLTIDLEARTCGGGSMTLYTGNGLQSLRRVRSGDPIRLKARRGTAYRLVVDCTRPGLGDFVLSLSDGSIKGKGVKLAVTPDQTVDSVLANGLRMTVSAKRRVGVGIDLRVSPQTARRLDLRTRVLGSTSGAVDYGKSLPAVLRLSRAARRALADVEHLNASVRLEILGTDAPNRVLTIPVRL
jgi:hypothetical protein